VEQLERSPLFTALTRPQMFAGVTYNYFVINAGVVTDQPVDPEVEKTRKYLGIFWRD